MSIEAPVADAAREGTGYRRSALIGSAFAVAWSPCIGPILGVVLTLAAASGTAAQGALLLAFYSLGLGVWFLAFGLLFGWIAPRIRALYPYLGRIMILSGVLFVAVGALMALGEFYRLNIYFQNFGFLFGTTESAERNLSGGVDGFTGPVIAFFGGMVSFLSPCVLPLVPAYLANLAGEALFGTGHPRTDRRRVLGHSAAFVLGFSAVFTVVGASLGFVGTLVQDSLDTLTRIGGVVLIALGLQMTGLVRIPYLDRTYQIPVEPG